MDSLSAFFFGFDDWLRQAAELHPLALYGLLFAIIFLESAFFPLAPFLPGDGLLLTTGLLGASGEVHLLPAGLLLCAGAALGNEVSYALGRRVGPGVFDRFSWLRREHYEKSRHFYERYGDWAVVLSRFLPLVRAVVPFVGGVAGMDRATFHRFSVLGVIIWVVGLLTVGYFLDRVPWLDRNLTTIIAVATTFFVLVAVVAIIRTIRHSRRVAAQSPSTPNR
ncbi:DedA family protein [Lewinella sp. IMCC34183]|uniref:DedA family protein n=1 Tax=Lewinella sp. IMCC34183 TaxID=2248762 RepID=UPI000E273083|nr:DedA family protein [Lewinella sp. IMCC34183]